MSHLKDMANYHEAVGHLELVLGKQESFWIEFRGQYTLAITCARVEFGPDMGKNRSYEDLGPKGEAAFQNLKQWVIRNYPWPRKRSSHASKEITTFRAAAGDKDRLKLLAERDQRTVSDLVNTAIQEFLARKAEAQSQS